MRMLNVKTHLKVRSLLMMTAVTALTMSSVLSGCGQRARLRLPAPAAESPVVKKADDAAKTTDATKTADTLKPVDTAKTDPATKPETTPPKEGTSIAPNSPVPPVEGADPIAETPAAPSNPVADDGGVRLYGAKGAALLEKLRVTGNSANSAILAALGLIEKGEVRVNNESLGLLQSAAIDSAPVGGSATEKAFCFLFRGDSRVKQTDSKNSTCPADQKPLTLAESKKLKVGKKNAHPCSDIRLVARHYENRWKLSAAVLSDLQKNNDDYKEIQSVLNGGQTIESLKTAGTKAGAMNFHIAVNQGHKQNNEAAKAIIAIAKAAKCSLKN